MKIENILKINRPEKDIVEMILSNFVDFGHPSGGLISVEQFSELAENLIVWKNKCVDESKLKK